MKISEIFFGLQGEIQIGMPAIFIRFSGCNLIKQNKGCKWCDSKFSEKEYKEMTTEQILKEVVKYKCDNIILTGGEVMSIPFLEFFPLLQELESRDYNISLETNGTIFDAGILEYVDKVNCSPKKQAIDRKVLEQFNKNSKVKFKFVYESEKEKWWEKLIEQLNIHPNKVYIMPEGKTRDEQLKRMKQVWEYCIKKGYHFTPRMHTLIYNNKRGV